MNQLRFAPLILSAIALVGCGKKESSLKEKVVGKWKADLELVDAKILKDLKEQEVREAEMDAELKKMKEMYSKVAIEFEFQSDGTHTMTMTDPDGESDTGEGKWEVESEEGNVLKLKTTEGKKDPETTILTFNGDDEFGLEVDSPGFKSMPFKIPIVFKRVKE